MKKIITFIALMVLTMTHIKADASTDVAATLTVTSRFSDALVSTVTTRNGVGYNLADTYTLSSFSSNDYDFAFIAINNYVREDALNTAYTMTSKQDVTIYFAPTTQYLVIYASPSGYIYGYTYIDKNFPFFDPNLAPTPNEVPFHTWSRTTPYSDRLGNTPDDPITKHTIFYANYESTLDALTLTTTNGVTFTNLTDSTYSFNDAVELTAPATSGVQVFSHFTDQYEQVIGYENPTTMTLTHDLVVTANYQATSPGLTDHVYISQQVDLNNRVAFSAHFELGSLKTLVEYGFIYTSDAGLTSFDATTAGVMISRNHNKTAFNDYAKSFLTSVRHVRAYIITKDASDNVYTTYSPIRTVSAAITYVETFDNLDLINTSITFTSGTYTGTGGTWTYTNALERTIDGSAMLLGGSSKLQSPTFGSSIQSITITYTGFNNGLVGFQVYDISGSNNTLVYTSSSVTSGTTTTATFVFGPSVTRFEIRTSIENRFLIIDNVTWRI